MKKFDTSLLRLMIASAAANLKNNRKQIDDLNIFPVPDGDTGTNMSLTFDGAAQQTLAEDFTSSDKLAAKLASAALRNARGNSGVILSQIFRGFNSAVGGKTELGAADFSACMTAGSAKAYRAVMRPVEGTILTVVRESSETAAKPSPPHHST